MNEITILATACIALICSNAYAIYELYKADKKILNLKYELSKKTFIHHIICRVYAKESK